jgi:Glycosyltransferase
LVIAGWDQGGHRRRIGTTCSRIEDYRFGALCRPLFGEARETAYQNANAFVLPSLSEGQPLVVLEAWSHARPVLMTPECNLPEGFEKQAAIRMNTTVEGAAEGLRKVVRFGRACSQGMGRRGRDLVIENFSWSQSASQMFAVYNWLLGRSGVPDCVLLD